MKKKELKKLLETLKKNRIRKKILDVIENTEREKFFDPIFREKLYGPEPIPIGFHEKSDSIPVLAKMIQLLDLKKKSRVLEIGTGSGYSTALLASLVSEVVTVEYHEKLALAAKERLQDAGLNNIKFYAGDGTDNREDLGFFDALIVFCGCNSNPYSVINLLNDEGSAVFPMGTPIQQQIILFKNLLSDGSIPQSKIEFHDFCEFDSIVGRYGWRKKIEFSPEYKKEIERGSLEPEEDQSDDPFSL
jgi:protein-L-isoaspartate(D-aspartate) O-methyltransferase